MSLCAELQRCHPLRVCDVVRSMSVVSEDLRLSASAAELRADAQTVRFAEGACKAAIEY